MAGRTQAGTTTRRRHTAHTHVTRCRPGQSHNGHGFPHGIPTHTSLGLHSAALPHMNPQDPAKPQVNSHTGGFTCSYLCGPWGSLLQPKTPGRIPGEATLQTGRPWDTRSPTRQAAETRTYTTPQTGPHRKARHPLPGRSDGVRTERPVRNRPQNSQPDTTTPPHSDAPNQPATRPSRGLPPTFRTADLIRSAPEWRG